MPTAKGDTAPSAKKPKKVGASVVVRKKKTIVKDSPSVKVKKTPKKIAVIAKKGKDSEKVKAVKKKVTLKKNVVGANKTANKTIIKKPKKNQNSKIISTDGKNKLEDSDVASPKAKKIKKSDEKDEKTKSEIKTEHKSTNVKNDLVQKDDAKLENVNLNKNESVKSPAKKSPSKINKKQIENSEAKSTVEEVKEVKIGAVKNVCGKKKLTNKSVKTDGKDKKIKIPKKDMKAKSPKVDKAKKVTKKYNTKKIKIPIKTVTDASVVENIVSQERKLTNCENQKDKNLKDDDVATKETIAKLLKQANKSILIKAASKNKKDALKSKTAVKKSKITKPKQKKVEIKQEYEEDVDFMDIKQVEKIIKSDKKLTKKEKEKDEVKVKSEIQESKEKERDQKVNKTNTTDHPGNTDDSSTSDELTLDVLRQKDIDTKVEDAKSKTVSPKKKIKLEPSSDTEKKPPKKTTKKVTPKTSRKIPQKKKVVIIKKRVLKQKDSSTDDQNGRKLKLYGFWSGPKRHRVASLNALAKVHCLYENESRGALMDVIKRSPATKDLSSDPEPSPGTPVEPSTRTLRSVPGLRGVGKHWEMHGDTSSSDDFDNDSSLEGSVKKFTLPPSYKQKMQQQQKTKETEKKQKEKVQKKPKENKEDDNIENKDEEKPKKKVIRKKRSRTELIMDLKDMVVRKRMASLNASAILAASYSVEKKPLRSPKSDDTTSSESESAESESSEKKRKCYEADIKKEDIKKEDRKVIEVHASPNKKVAVILNQDTDVTITGVYVNSTTRSTHHEGYCSIAGMQYRISATSHTQTAATAVATETLLHSTTDHVSECYCFAF